jgi:pimeloyl-ACP methyl ester carboxylesterase
MRRLLAASFLLAALAGLAIDPPPADAQPPAKPDPESFNTADGVRLKGLFHKSPKGGTQGDAVVVLLYPPGPEKSMLKGDWDGLIGKLNDAGFHVFRFDWRGHGESTDITDPLGDNPFTGFWTNQITGRWNARFVKGVNKRPAKNDIRVKTDVSAGYFPVYVNDLAAVRLHLDQKNDQGQLNSSSIYLIGAGDAATLGLMWIAAEWKRPAVAPMLPGGLQYKSVPQSTLVPPDPPAGMDIAGAIWLSGIRSTTVPEYVAQGWAKDAPKMRDNNKMLFVYGADDAPAKSAAEAFYNKILVAGGNKAIGVSAIDQTFLFPIAKTKLNGIALLGKDDVTKTETKSIEYLNARQKDRVNMIRKNRNYVSPYYIDVSRFGVGP